MKNNHIIPKADPYCGNGLIVVVIRLFAFILGLAVGFALGDLFCLKSGRGLVRVFWFFPAFVLWLMLTELLSIGFLVIVTLISKKVCGKMTDEEKQLVRSASSVEWYPVTQEMTEYLQKRKKFPWFAAAVFVILLILVFVCRGMIFIAVICGVIGNIQCRRSNMSCVSPEAEYHIAEVHHTFSKFRVNYAVVYLPFGRFVYKVKSSDTEKVVFLSYKSQTRFVCDEEFLEFVRNR